MHTDLVGGNEESKNGKYHGEAVLINYGVLDAGVIAVSQAVFREGMAAVFRHT